VNRFLSFAGIRLRKPRFDREVDSGFDLRANLSYLNELSYWAIAPYCRGKQTG
jgi:hypothetical protein